ncbi:MAG: hypothetical protein AMXMBFR64_10630 [Myxococcales bacterium]
MLNLRSFRDYPDVFRDGGEDAVLSDREKEAAALLAVRSRRQLWVLGRLTVKELVQRWYDEHGAQVPGARQISVLPAPGGAPTIRVEGDPVRRLSTSISYCDAHAFASVRDADPGHRFAVVMDRIEPLYPFFDDSLLTEDEVSRVRHEEAATQNQLLTAFGCLKKGVGKALGLTSAAPASHVEVLAVTPGGEATVRYDPELFGGDTRPVVRGRVWFYDTYVLAFAGLWRSEEAAPPALARIEEEPVLPDSRYTEWSR